MKSFLISILMLAAVIPTICHAEKRVALVIGNGNYQMVTPLTNPTKDAHAIAEKLKSLNFQVVEGYDVDILTLQQKIREFSHVAVDADINLFYYAGHGLGVGGKNYLVPVDARFESSADLDFETVEVDTVMRQMQASHGVSLVFLDACRDNPFMASAVSKSLSSGARAVTISRGLVPVEIVDAGKGMAVAFATSPGDVAYDGEGDHSPFTNALLKYIDKPNTSISEVMAYVTGDVRTSTNDRQKPWLNASLTGPVVLNPVATVVASNETAVIPASNPTVSTANGGGANGAGANVAGATDRLEDQKALFSIATSSDRADDYSAYLDVFPNGLFAGNAHKALDRLQATAVLQNATRSGQTLIPSQTVANAPVVLAVTPDMRAMPANLGTEAALAMDRTKVRELQARLNLDGVNSGTPDGSLGPGSRSAILQWQSLQGLVPTSYFNAVQLEYLKNRTDAAYQIWAVNNPPPKPSTARRSTSSGRSRAQGDAVAAFIFGSVLGGMLASH